MEGRRWIASARIEKTKKEPEEGEILIEIKTETELEKGRGKEKGEKEKGEKEKEGKEKEGKENGGKEKERGTRGEMETEKETGEITKIKAKVVALHLIC
jgi:hypothetical protein